MGLLVIPSGRTSWTDLLNRPAEWTSWTDILDRPAGRTSFFLFEALATLHIQRISFQFVYCCSFRPRRRPCLFQNPFLHGSKWHWQKPLLVHQDLVKNIYILLNTQTEMEREKSNKLFFLSKVLYIDKFPPPPLHTHTNTFPGGWVGVGWVGNNQT